ncbi:hypothetical protein CKO38_11255 [Rhodospirillum rubrum]|uniref:HAD family hydrolase n=1 Tax=Rhodospirillum rubrum TaxID=1085 RepID=UPI001904202F|nr:hypothetical protein [Rhodospirillum rubrum]MBK1664618.1 hypothetical protein [Rhodospirillum rubrum]MBK1677231.1 hypothetical protein [Rhodospirillum rubrum]
MRRVVFVDLDDTLFQTARKNPGAQALAALDRDGKPLSFQSTRQVAFLEWLSADAVIVPVTGRSVEAFRRVTLPLGPRAICSFGGVILGADGLPHPEWHRQMSQKAQATARVMEQLDHTVGQAVARTGVDARHHIIHDAELALYLSIKHNGGSAEETARLAQALAPAVPEGWTTHLNGANMALLPPFLGKRAAVAFFLETQLGDGPLLTIGFGDSLTDLGFMSLCDYALTPSRSQILGFLNTTWPDVAAMADSAA